ncbi:MAG: cytidylate kinase-like family protein [Oscillospiraceae bacterium]|nr:cytidylate kinase-like family protein [Oscillospiraceae bacterium]
MQKLIITIGRQFCSGGSEIGRKLSERLGIPYYDKNLYEFAAKNRGFSTKYVKEVEETPTGSFLYSMAMFPYMDFGADNMIPSGIAIAADQTSYILEKAKEGPCIFVGRCADSVLSERKDVFNVFIYADQESRLKRAMERYGLSEKEAIKSIQQTDKYRASYYNMNSQKKKWGVKESYHIMLDSGALGIDGVVDILEKIYRDKTEK